jgi:hopanoid biosynthesis associated RND transporter like protein HpnN
MAFASAAQAYRRFLVRWTDGVRRLAWLVVVLSALSSVAAAYYLAVNARIITSNENMLSADLPFRKNAAAISEAFPKLSDNIVIVIDGQTPDLADDAAAALKVKLREQPDLFGDVFDPKGSEFFRKNGFLYLDTKDLYELSDKLAQAQPFLGALWRDPSLVGLFTMFNLAIDETLKEKGARPIEMARALNAVAEVVDAQAAGKFRHFSWQELMAGEKDDDAASNRRLIVIQPVLDFQSLQPAARAMAALRGIARDLKLTPENGVRMRLTGAAAMEHEELKSVEDSMGLASVLSIVMVTGLLVIGLRSFRLVMTTSLTLFAGLIWTAAFGILSLGAFNLISVAFAVLFIGLSIDFGIHYGLRYQEGIDRGVDHATALAEASEGVGGALTLCTVSAAIAFYSFLPTAYIGLAELGLIAGTGMFIAFFANITLLPALLTVMPPRTGAGRLPPSRFAPAMTAFRSFLKRRSRAVCWLALAFGVVAGLLLPKTTFDFDPFRLRDPNTESVATALQLMADRNTSPYSITILAENLKSAEALAAKLKKLPAVDKTVTLTDFVPNGQPEKLDVIATMALFLSPSFAAAGTAAPPTPADRSRALEEFRGRLKSLAAMPGGGADSKAASRLFKALDELSASAGAAPGMMLDLEKRLLTALPGRLRQLDQALTAAPVTLESLPAEIKQRYVAGDGRTRLEVHPKETLADRQSIIRFVTAVRTVAPDASGSPVVILEAGNAVLRAFWQAGLISVALITTMLIAILERWRDTALVFAPLLLAGLLTVATAVAIGLPFNFANIIVLPLLFGLGVASGIHLVVREGEEDDIGSALETSTPRAVVFSALTTIGSFGSIALSSHPGTSSMGVLLTVAIAMTLVCTLIVLPALVEAVGAGKPETDKS